jgi:hypothetical protein
VRRPRRGAGRPPTAWPVEGVRPVGRAVAGARRDLASSPAAAPTCTRPIDTEGRTDDRRSDFRRGLRRLGLELRERGRRRLDGLLEHVAGGRTRGAARRGPRGAGRCRGRPGRALRGARTLRLLGRRRRDCSTSAVPRSPTTCAARWSATTSPTSSTGTSTSPTSATSGAGSARSPSARATPTPTRCPWSEVADRAAEAWERRRDRGVHAGRHRPRAAGDGVLRPGGARSRSAGSPRCTCTPSPPWRSSTARPGPGCPSSDFLLKPPARRGSGRMPGTAAEILDDEVRWVLTKGKLPTSDLGRDRGDRALAWGCRRPPR